MCVQFFTAFELAVFKVICTLVSAVKSKMAAISLEMNRGKKLLFFHIDHNYPCIFPCRWDAPDMYALGVGLQLRSNLHAWGHYSPALTSSQRSFDCLQFSF